jgi:hypothetical protein
MVKNRSLFCGPWTGRRGLGPRNRGPIPWVFQQKNNSVISEIAGTWYFYKNTHELFQNYILVPIVLQIGP